MAQVSKVAIHPKVIDIRNHLLTGSMTVKEIVSFYGTEEHPLTKDAVNWYKRKYLKKEIEAAELEIKEEVQENIRRLRYKLLDILEDRIQTYYDKYRDLPITNREVIEFMKLYAQVKGEGQYNTVHMKTSWGTKLKDSPEYKKGKVFTMDDLNKMK